MMLLSVNTEYSKVQTADYYRSFEYSVFITTEALNLKKRVFGPALQVDAI